MHLNRVTLIGFIGNDAEKKVAGTTNISEIASRINDAQYPALLYAGAAMMLVGFGFKIATAPFHIWTPDVYEGAPTPVTAFMAAGPKAAGFASFMRVFVFGLPFVVSASNATTGNLHQAWLSVLVVMAILTMTLGNVVAIVQNNVKRMLAYSSIAHAGYAMVGFIAAGSTPDLNQRHTAITAVTHGAYPYGGLDLARLYDDHQDVAATLGAHQPSSFGVVVRNKRGTVRLATARAD